MKQILFILLAAISFSSKAQIHINSLPDNSFYGVIKDNSDTFEIQHLGNIRFIKIEGEVYEITRKTELKKVEPQSMRSEWFAVPNYSDNYISSDTLSILHPIDNMPVYNFHTGHVEYTDSTYFNHLINPPKKKSKKK